MRLIKVGSLDTIGEPLQLETFMRPPKAYAILSHTWGADEVLFEDIQKEHYTDKPGYNKIKLAAREAKIDGYDYIWVDTCCIDKSSSAELSEAINSMFQWYQRASVCYVYLEDVDVSLHETGFDDQFLKSRWHSRGWTLQELLAPSLTKFFNRDWKPLGRTSGWILSDAHARDYFIWLLTKATGIDKSFLYGFQRRSHTSASIALRMHWASLRHTSRDEDIAYCLLGLFDVNMPLFYGEGSTKAFLRLQKEIMKQSDDHSLFAWTRPDSLERRKASATYRLHGLLADHPSDFKDTSAFFKPSQPRLWSDSDPYFLASRGLQIALPLRHVALNIYLAILDCVEEDSGDMVAVYLRRLDSEKIIFSRVFFDRLVLESPVAVSELQRSQLQPMFIRQIPYGLDELGPHLHQRCVQYRIHPDASTLLEHRLLYIRRDTQSSDGPWESLADRTFNNGILEDTILRIEHIASEEIMIVRVGCLAGFFVGFNACDPKDSNAERSIKDESWMPERHVPGEEIDLELTKCVSQIRLDIVNDSEAAEDKITAVFELQLSIKTTVTAVPEVRLPVPQLVIRRSLIEDPVDLQTTRSKDWHDELKERMHDAG